MTPDKRVEKELDRWLQDQAVLTKVKVTQLLTQYHQDMMSEVVEKFKHYWYHAGEWHDAGCAFVCVDHGVCNCNLGANKTIIKSLSK